MALFRILKGNEVNLPEKKREGFAYFTIDENDFYIDTESSTTNAAGKESGGARKQLNANRAHYLKSKDINKNVLFDQLYIDDEEISLGRKAGESNYETAYNASVVTSAGMKSIAVGYAASATGNYSSSFGSSTIADGIDSHAEGRAAKAYGEASHAEGVDTLAEGDFSHAEGDHTTASGDKSHAGGYYSSTNGKIGAFTHGSHVVAQADYQTVFGKYSNALTTDAFIIGNGTSNTERSNIFSVDWDGHATLKDSLLVGRDPVLNLEVTTKQYVDAKIDMVGGTLKYSENQELTEEQKHVARSNIGIDISSDVKFNSVAIEFLSIKDKITGYDYFISMENGVIVYSAKLKTIEITKAPDTMIYFEGDNLDSSMVVTATYEDGKTSEITDYTYELVGGNTSVEIFYTENGVTCTTILEGVVINSIKDLLIDFKYTDNGNGTYTITDWKGTYNGVYSNELIVPDSDKIIVSIDQ